MKKKTNWILFTFLSVLFFVETTYQQEKQQQNPKSRTKKSSDYLFDINSDLNIEVEQSDGTLSYLEAFKSSVNDKIIAEANPSKYGQLHWFSLGYPRLKTISSQTNISLPLKITTKGFYILVEMLTQSQRGLFKEKIKRKYGLDVEEDQITNLVPGQFECFIDIECDECEYTLRGRAFHFRDFPIRVEFNGYGKKSPEKICLQKLITATIDDHDELLFKCNVSSKHNKLAQGKQNGLIVTASKLNELGLVDKLFGSDEVAFVTRNQLVQLATSLFSSLPKFEAAATKEFINDFVDEIVRQTSSSFEKVPIDSALISLSKYSIAENNSSSTATPDVIKSELAKMFQVRKETGKSAYIATNENELKQMGVFCKADIVLVKTNQRDWEQSQKSLADQLDEINSAGDASVEWQLTPDNTRLMPKSLNVAKLVKAKLKQNFVFNRSLNTIKDSTVIDGGKFERAFTLSDKKMIADVTTSLIVSQNRNKALDLVEIYFDKTRRIEDNLELLRQSFESFHNRTMQSKSNEETFEHLKPPLLVEDYNNSSNSESTGKKPKNGTKKGVQNNSQNIKKVLSNHTHTVWCLIQLNEELIATGSYDYTVKIWNITDGTVQLTLVNHSNWVTSLLKLNEQTIVSGSQDKTIKIWNVTNGKLIKTLVNQHTQGVNDLIKLNETCIASVSYDRTVKVWQVSDWSVRKTITTPQAIRTLVALNADEIAVANDADYMIRIYNVNYGRLIFTLAGHTYYVDSLLKLNDRLVISGSWDRTMKLWDVTNGLLLKNLTYTGSPVYSLVKLSDDYIACGLLDATIRIISTVDWTIKYTLFGHSSVVSSLIKLDGATVASGSYDSTAIVWDLPLI